MGIYDSTSEVTSYGQYLRDIALGTTGSADNFFSFNTAVDTLSVKSVRGLGVLEDLYQKLATALSQSYTMTGSLSTSLTAGTTYWLKLVFSAPVSGGGTLTSTVIISFVAQ